MSFVKVGRLATLPPGSVMQVEAGGETVAVCNAGGDLHALDGICPHAGGPLGHGALHGTTLVCPWHAWEYDLETGECLWNPRYRVRVYPVEVAADGTVTVTM
jgi:nitrite reductase/ring-hydroxylating ferredoxin subunit